MEKPKTFLLDEATGQQFLNYLAKRPYAEVYQIVAALGNLPVVEETAEPASQE